MDNIFIYNCGISSILTDCFRGKHTTLEYQFQTAYSKADCAVETIRLQDSAGKTFGKLAVKAEGKHGVIERSVKGKAHTYGHEFNILPVEKLQRH